MEEHKEIYLTCATCREVFPYSALKLKINTYGAAKVEDKTCPYCGSISWSAFKDIRWFERYFKKC